ncbi:MAG TPA: polysaccharide biosynthesis tyrosine autokinase [Rhodothermales bacterium]
MSKIKPYKSNQLYRHPGRRAGRANVAGWYVTGDGLGNGTGRSGRDQIEEALDLLYRRKWIILVCFVLLVAGAAWYTYPIVPRYEASSFIMVNLPNTQGRTGGQSDIDNPFSENTRPVYEELLLLRISSPLAQRVAEELQSMKEWPNGKPIRLLYDANGQPRSSAEIAARLPSQVTFKQEAGSFNIIRVTATNTEPEAAATLANLFAREYEELTREAGRDRFDESRAFLEGQENHWRNELTRIEAQIGAYSAETGIASMAGGSSTLITQIATLEAERENARFDIEQREKEILRLQAEINQLRPLIRSEMTYGLQDSVNTVKAQIDSLDALYQAIETRYPNEKPAVSINEQQRIRERLAVLRPLHQELNQRLIDRTISTGGMDSQSLLARVNGLTGRIESERQQIRGLESRILFIERELADQRSKFDRIPAQSRVMAELDRSRVYAEQMYQNVSTRLLDMRMQVEPTEGTGYVRVLQEANIPVLPLPTDEMRNMILGAFLGLVIGLALALVRDKFDNRIYKPEQLRDQGHLPIGVIPNMKAFLKARRQANGKAVGTNGSQAHIPILFDAGSPVSEAYRPLRMNVQFSSPNGNVRTVAVVSAGVGEGKSLTASSLAISMARAGNRTVLVDADLMRPQVHSLLGLQNEVGLIQVLREGAPIDVDFFTTDVPNLWAIPSGGRANDSAELLGSPRMNEAFEQLKDLFDVVVIDTPPTLAVTDAALVAARCDATVVVTRAGKTKEKELDRCVEVLESVGATIVGVTLNDFDITMAYGYKYRYRQYNEYGPYAGYASAG